MKFAAAKVALEPAPARFNELFGRGLVLSVALISGLGLAVDALVFVFFNSTRPNTLTLTAGPGASALRASPSNTARSSHASGRTPC
ncbi:MAG: hypothetical protein KGL43_14335 [Burkholderiales bacterium]|nr:hypothetical protein [Burkholderiales bacterium]